MNGRRCGWVLASWILLLGCQSSGEDEPRGSDSSGGQGTGGSATGGETAAGGSATGGETAAGGSATGGETAAGGSATGGETAAGGSATGGAPSSGCGVTGAATGVQERTLMVGGAERTYVLSVPESYDASTPLPLVFAWHGLGGDGAMARMYFRIEDASGGGAIFAYPDGLPNEQGQAGWDLAADGGDVAYFDTLLAALSAEYCVDASRVFSTGHSFGGFFTNRLGCSRASVLRAVAPVAGGPPFGGPGAACTPAVAAWIAHGDNDETVDFSMGEDARDAYVAANACGTTTVAVEPSPCVAHEGCAAGRPVHWCLHQDGHNWPSFAAAGIWRFFAQY
ncbi:MAG: Ricin and poly(3-hydroxybutyrate) depolymerase fusion [Polyangiaceae bacterium]|nr:Ricin and poly(3-hydroxybutyrate) depolymerase fusion [Polyangiaceae bacterium]